MKKKICMLTLAVALSATALVGCSSDKKDLQTTEYEGEAETPEDLEVIPENASDDAAGDDNAENEADNANETSDDEEAAGEDTDASEAENTNADADEDTSAEE